MKRGEVWQPIHQLNSLSAKGSEKSPIVHLTEVTAMGNNECVQKFCIIYHLYGGLEPLRDLSLADFVFKKTDKLIVARYDFTATNELEAKSREEEINERFEYLLDVISLKKQQGIGVQWSSRVLKAGPYGKTEVSVALKTEEVKDIKEFFENHLPTLQQDRKLQLAIRWYRKSFLANHLDDAFLAIWIALEAQVKKQSRKLGQKTKAALDRAESCIREHFPAQKFPKLRSIAIQDWKEYVQRKGIAEAITDKIKLTLGKRYTLFGKPLSDEIHDLQNDRSKLVHKGERITDVENKTAKIRSTVWRMIMEQLKQDRPDAKLKANQSGNGHGMVASAPSL